MHAYVTQIRMEVRMFWDLILQNRFLFLSSLLIPVIIYMHMTIRNGFLLPLFMDMINPLLLEILSTGIFLLSCRCFHNGVLAFLHSQLPTIFFFTYRFYNKLVLNVLEVGVTTCYLLLFLILGGIMFICFRKWKWNLNRTGEILIFCTIMLLFLFQCVYLLHLNFQRKPFIDRQYIQTPKISPNLPSPNIYWVHCDGLLGRNSFRKYFKDSQESFCRELQKRSFFIYDSARLNSNCSTISAVAALMNPEYYDKALASSLLPGRNEQWLFIHEDQLAFYRLVANQFYRSFEKKGYQVTVIPKDLWSASYVEIYSSMEEYYCSRLELKNFEIFGYISRWMPSSLLYQKWENIAETIPPVKLPEITEEYVEKNFAYFHAVHHLPVPQKPSLTVIKCFSAHVPYIYDQKGDLISSLSDNSNPADYAAQHFLTTRILLWTVEKILEKDPDALIVLQADHGLHCSTRKQLLDFFGEDCNPDDLWNQVFSAVRVPLRFRNGTEAYMAQSPLNIVRYLINSFVGEGNCSYITPEQNGGK